MGNDAKKLPVGSGSDSKGPDVDRPAGPIGTIGPNYTTHSADPAKTIRATEGIDISKADNDE